MSERGSVGGRERRLSPRYNVVLGCQISLPEEERSSVILFPDAGVAGRTRDVSETGLGVAVATIYAGYDCVVDQGRALRVTLSLPAGDVEMRATAVHYVRQDTAGSESAYVIGLRITGMDAGPRALYTDFLKGLSGD